MAELMAEFGQSAEYYLDGIPMWMFTRLLEQAKRRHREEEITARRKIGMIGLAVGAAMGGGSGAEDFLGTLLDSSADDDEAGPGRPEPSSIQLAEAGMGIITTTQRLVIPPAHPV